MTTRKGWPFNTGDCLIEVTTWEGLTVNELQIVFYIQLFKCVSGSILSNRALSVRNTAKSSVKHVSDKCVV
jgi:hypothetical protein